MDQTYPPMRSKEGDLLFFKFTDELLTIIVKNFDSLLKYDTFKSNISQLNDMRIPRFVDPSKPGVLSISLLISNDGVSFVIFLEKSLAALDRNC